MEPVLQFGTVQQITGKNTPVVCTAKVIGVRHVSAFVVNRQTWGYLGLRLPGKYHICRSEARKGCAAASILRAVGLALSMRAPDATLDLQITDIDTVTLLHQWQSGDTTPPVWYAGGPEGSLVELAELVARQPDHFRVNRAPTRGLPLVGAAVNIARIVATSMHQNATDEEKDIDKNLRASLGRLPRTS